MAQDHDFVPEQTASELLMPYYEPMNAYGGVKKSSLFLKGFASMPFPVQHLFAVIWCDIEVCNGGFDQFYSNSSGIIAPEALLGYRALGFLEMAAILGETLKIFGPEFPRLRTFRNIALKKYRLPGKERDDWDPLHPSDKRYFAMRKKLPFDEMLDDYARKNISP